LESVGFEKLNDVMMSIIIFAVKDFDDDRHQCIFMDFADGIPNI